VVLGSRKMIYCCSLPHIVVVRDTYTERGCGGNVQIMFIVRIYTYTRTYIYMYPPHILVVECANMESV